MLNKLYFAEYGLTIHQFPFDNKNYNTVQRFEVFLVTFIAKKEMYKC